MKRLIFGCTIIICGCMAGATALICGAIKGVDESLYLAISTFIVAVGLVTAGVGGYFHTTKHK